MIKPIRDSYLQLLQYISAAGMKHLGGWYYAVYRSLVRRWFPVGNWCVLVGTEVIYWSDSTINKQAKLNLVAHMWSKDS